MALLLKNDLLYLHIPKTGGNWLTKLLQDNDCVRLSVEDKHATYDLVSGRLRRPSFAEQARKFTTCGLEGLHYMVVVRNPLAWYESWFKYQTAREFMDWGSVGNPHKWHVMSSINSAKQNEFNKFVLAIHEAHPGFVTSLYAAYAARSAAIVLKQENIRQDFAVINDRFALGVPLGEIFGSEEYGVSPKLEIIWEEEVFDMTLRLEQACFMTYDFGWDDVVTVR